MNIKTVSYYLKMELKNSQRLGLSKIRRKMINKSNFTIISNNCWGGMIYESYGLIKQTPTVGLYFLPKDYIKFIGNLEYYLSQKLKFIDPYSSKNLRAIKEIVKDKHYGEYPVGKIDDIEIYFLHYRSKKSAFEKWNRRINRIDFNHILFKFNDQNGCSLEDLINFKNLNLQNKICFTVLDNFKGEKEFIHIKDTQHNGFVDVFDEPFGKSKYLDVNLLINEL